MDGRCNRRYKATVRAPPDPAAVDVRWLARANRCKDAVGSCGRRGPRRFRAQARAAWPSEPKSGPSLMIRTTRHTIHPRQRSSAASREGLARRRRLTGATEPCPIVEFLQPRMLEWRHGRRRQVRPAVAFLARRARVVDWVEEAERAGPFLGCLGGGGLTASGDRRRVQEVAFWRSMRTSEGSSGRPVDRVRFDARYVAGDVLSTLCGGESRTEVHVFAQRRMVEISIRPGTGPKRRERPGPSSRSRRHGSPRNDTA